MKQGNMQNPGQGVHQDRPGGILPNRALQIICLGLLLLLSGVFLAPSCWNMPEPPSPSATTSNVTPVYSYRVVNAYPHDPNAFTQGLVFKDGILYEGTGQRNHSSLRKIDPESGEILQIHRLPARFFGEGVTVYQDKIIQLTWQSNTGFVYDKDSFELLQEFNYPGEGWGITHDGRRLIMSDGTSTLHLLDPNNFSETGHLDVHDQNNPVTRLNELEYIQGEIYANIWKTDRIARISAITGQVTAWIEMEGLLRDRPEPVDVLNGIAYDATEDRLLVTGKLWPWLFEIELVPPE